LGGRRSEIEGQVAGLSFTSFKFPVAGFENRQSAIGNEMSSSHQTATRPAMAAIPESVCAKLYRQAGAEKFGLAQGDFAGILQEVVTKYLPAGAGPSEVLELLMNLRVEELALARSCARGNEAAWEIFLNRYREKLYNAAHSIAPEDSTARDLADSLYADLYGTRTADGRRISKLNSFTGRGSLEGWLRAVLAQEYVNRYRRQQRLVSLEERSEAGVQFPAEDPDPTQALDSRLEEATDLALAALAAEDKYILASYYLDGRTLAEIGRLLGVHESTVSRKLERITASTRKAIRADLVKRGMSSKEAEQAMEVEVSEFSLDVRRRLIEGIGNRE
jgi:RNA polymerase sigma-70 factor (ECF subfamily)